MSETQGPPDLREELKRLIESYGCDCYEVGWCDGSQANAEADAAARQAREASEIALFDKIDALRSRISESP